MGVAVIVNVLRFSFKAEVPEEEKAEVLAAMRRTASTEAVSFATVGQDLGDPAEGFTHGYLVAIPDLDALERYMHDPVHLAGDEYILGRLAKLSAVRLSDDLTPDLQQTIFSMHTRKVEMYPEWGHEVANLFGAGQLQA
jgi:hypothetical protein